MERKRLKRQGLFDVPGRPDEDDEDGVLGGPTGDSGLFGGPARSSGLFDAPDRAPGEMPGLFYKAPRPATDGSSTPDKPARPAVGGLFDKPTRGGLFDKPARRRK
jgi:hypothetical protein